MEFMKLIEMRYSVRAYRPDPVPEEALNRVLGAMGIAPTAANRQPFQAIVIHTEGRKEELLRIYGKEWFVQGPLVIGICAVHSEAWTRSFDKKRHSDVDAAIAMDHLILAATDAGLGSCWVANFDPKAAQEILGLPAGIEPVCFTPLGYPADNAGPKKRKPLNTLVKYERW